MYPYSIPEVIITELVANSLDARSELIDISYNYDKKQLVVEDNGLGMSRKQFNEYHDFVAGLKPKGTGIGFAGLGAKISFNIASRVLTETWGSKFKGISNWYLKSQKELVWKELKELNLLKHAGTRVEVYFNSKKGPDFCSHLDLEKILLRHFLPLFDKKFLEIYNTLGFYSENLRFKINGTVIEPFNLEEKFNLGKVKKIFFESRGKRYSYGLFGIASKDSVMGEDASGIGLSVYGKLIQFDFFGQFPGDLGPKIFGIVEVPPFIKFLNTSKTTFIKSRGSLKKFNKFYDPIREQFKEWLKEIGIKPIEAINTEEAMRLEKELKKIIVQIPEISQLFGLKSKVNVTVNDPVGDVKAALEEGVKKTFPDEESQRKAGDLEEEKANGNLEKSPGISDIGDELGSRLEENIKGQNRASPITRKRKAGVRVSFADRPDRNELAWLERDIIVINNAHSSYRKIKRNNLSRKIHNLFAIAVASNREMQQQGILKENEFFVDEIMSKWVVSNEAQ